MKAFVATVLVIAACTAYADAGSIRRARGSVKSSASKLKRHAKDDEPIYGEGIPGFAAKIIDQYFNLHPNVSYDFGYLQTDLQRRQEEATFKEDPENQQYVIEKVSGYYKYLRPDGNWQRVDYEADENGFRPVIKVTKYDRFNDDSYEESDEYERPLQVGSSIEQISEESFEEDEDESSETKFRGIKPNSFKALSPRKKTKF